MKTGFRKAPALLIASLAAVGGLVIFQLTWMRYSRQLSNELFYQRACMALCSTVENYGGGALCSKAGCTPACQQPGGDVFTVPANLAGDSAFNADLRRSLDFYQIDLDYKMALTEAATPEQNNRAYQCAVPIAQGEAGQSAFIQLDFPDKEGFALGRMSFMVLATVLILLFTSVVLLLANWSLLKQKRLLQTNVDFFNNMAHEFRTPLTNMGLAANMLSKRHKELGENEFLAIIKRENAKLFSQVERVLHLARLENGDYVLQKERLHLKSLLRSVCDEMAMQIEERQATVSLEAVPDDMEVFADKLHIGNVFRNLLDNALKYTESIPEIRISAQEQPKGILVQVQDNGSGIPPEKCKLVFEKFQRATKGDLHEQKGFGLGLAYVKRMVEMHGGFVRVHSEVNSGSRFEVCLPHIKVTAA